MSSTLKNLLFWVVLIVVGILIWNFSSNFQQRDTPIPFSQFVCDRIDEMAHSKSAATSAPEAVRNAG